MPIDIKSTTIHYRRLEPLRMMAINLDISWASAAGDNNKQELVSSKLLCPIMLPFQDLWMRLEEISVPFVN